MSKQRIHLIAALSAIACFLGTTAAHANNTPSTSPSATYGQSAATSSITSASMSQDQLRLATDGDSRSLEDYQGKKVSGSDGQELGKVSDFIIDAKTGKVAYAVVSSDGSAGAEGSQLRLVQQSSLRASESADGELTAQLDKSAFEAMPTVDRNELKADRIVKISSLNQQISANAGQQSPTDTPATTADDPVTVTAAPSTSSTTDSTMPDATHLVLVSDLKGQQVGSGDETAGTIEGVALDLAQGTATALLKTNSTSFGSDQQFHVPFTKLEFGSPGADQVTTTLTRSDFTQAQSSSQASTDSTNAATTSTEDSPTPTGRTTASTDPSSSAQPTEPYATDPSSTGSTLSTTSSTGVTGSSSTSIDTTGAVSSSTTTATDPSISSPDTSTSTTASSTLPSSTTDLNPATSSQVPGTDITSSSTASSEYPTSETPSPSVAATDPTSSTTTSVDEQPSPTGRDSSHPLYALSTAAAAIRSALTSDETFASEDIRVQEAGKKIMLHGKVSSEETKTQIEQLAKNAAAGVEIENKIKVER